MKNENSTKKEEAEGLKKLATGKRVKIKRKILFTVITCLTLVAASVAVAIVQMERICDKYDYALTNYGFAQGDIANALATFIRLDSSLHDSVNYFDVLDMRQAIEDVNTHKKTFEEEMVTVKEGISTDKEQNCYNEITEAWDEYQIVGQEILDTASGSNDMSLMQKAQKRMVNELDPYYMTIHDNMVELLTAKQEQGDNLKNTIGNSVKITVVFCVVVAAAAITVGLVLGNIVANRISKPMQACVERLKLLAQGNLSEKMPEINTDDETKELADATGEIVETLKKVIGDISYLMKEMAIGNFEVCSRADEAYVGDYKPLLDNLHKISSDLSETLLQIRQSADQVTSGAEQVSTGSQALAQGATEQASAIEELAATINDISATIQKTAKDADAARVLTGEAGSEMDVASQQMQKMVEAMNEISKTSGEISKVIKTIEDIAFQTNILALNAAVEAARAGEAGKGFAVVADEVRNLANKSAEASQSTASLIESAIRAVGKGTEIAGITAHSMNEVGTKSKQVVERITTIAQASDAQAAAIDQITQGIDQISSVVQTNSATSEESAAASEELSSHAELMREQIARFKLRDEMDLNPNAVDASGSNVGSSYSAAQRNDLVGIGNKY